MSVSSSDTATVEGAAESVALDEFAEYVEMLRQVQRNLDHWGKLRVELQNKIKDELGDAEVGTLRGRPVVSWKRTLRVSLSQKLIKTLHPEVIGDCEEITEVRSFRLLP